jgi:hypothetical protein
MDRFAPALTMAATDNGEFCPLRQFAFPFTGQVE